MAPFHEACSTLRVWTRRRTRATLRMTCLDSTGLGTGTSHFSKAAPAGRYSYVILPLCCSHFNS
eukprot:1154561-Pelagomonas_calceolata.AAC.1